MKQRVPRLNHNTLSVHLLDRGAGTRSVVTFHRMEDEGEVNKDSQKWTDAESADSGIIGRIVAGVRKKLQKVILGGGVATTGGELADSSAALAFSLVECIHGFSIGSLGPFHEWVTDLQEDIELCSVTKHAHHIKDLREKLQGMMYLVFFGLKTPKFFFNVPKLALKTYLSPVHEIFRDMVDPDSDLVKDTDPHVLRSLPNVERVLLGDEVTGVKGTKYWTERLEFYSKKVDEIEEIYVGKLNEQRNSFTFTLSIFTLLTFPISFLPGYWGMNFSNTVELYSEGFPVPGTNETLWVSPNFFPKSFQGVDVFWTANGFIYALIVIACLHYRIFYTAS